jgi:hypothetical protein
MTRRTWAAMACGLLAGILSAGCSPAAGTGEATVFTVATGFSQGGPASTIDTVNIGVPGGQNVTGHSVRFESVRLAGVPAAAHLSSVFAYRQSVGVIFGNMHKECPEDRQYPLTAAVLPPHAETQWNIVLAITFAKAGRYDLHHVKIYYVTDGHHGWQYQNINTTMVISAARKGAKPAFDGCPP